MLPGLLIGLVISTVVGGGIKEYFWIPAAAGLIGMSFGGIEPYGDTISFVVDKGVPWHAPFKGVAGLALKGALWFSICGGIIGLSLSAMGGRYAIWQLLLFCLLIPPCQSVGYYIFNKPYDRAKKITPKTYFSYESREEWGSNAGVLTLLVVFTALSGDILGLVMALCGFIGGAIGWIVAIGFYWLTENPLSNGRYLFGKKIHRFFEEYVGGWGVMEYVLGTIGACGIAAGVWIAYAEVEKINASIAAEGLTTLPKSFDVPVVVYMGFLALGLWFINALQFYGSRKGLHFNSFVMDCLERPMFNVAPLIPVLLCSLPAARLMTVFMLLFALSLKCSYDRLEDRQGRVVFTIISFGVCIGTFVLDIVIGGFSRVGLVIAGSIPYLLSELLWSITKKPGSTVKAGLKALFKISAFTTKFYFLLLSAAIICCFVAC
jgi:hypothetical protein